MKRNRCECGRKKQSGDFCLKCIKKIKAKASKPLVVNKIPDAIDVCEEAHNVIQEKKAKVIDTECSIKSKRKKKVAK